MKTLHDGQIFIYLPGLLEHCGYKKLTVMQIVQNEASNKIIFELHKSSYPVHEHMHMCILFF